MKVTIKSVTNKIQLARLIREIFPAKSISEIWNILQSPSYTFENIDSYTADMMKKKFTKFASVELQHELDDVENLMEIFNHNIVPPPQEYLDANAWYETLSEQHKSFVNVIVQWRPRAVAC